MDAYAVMSPLVVSPQLQIPEPGVEILLHTLV
jgi:hypothetical protein